MSNTLTGPSSQKQVLGPSAPRCTKGPLSRRWDKLHLHPQYCHFLPDGMLMNSGGAGSPWDDLNDPRKSPPGLLNMVGTIWVAGDHYQINQSLQSRLIYRRANDQEIIAKIARMMRFPAARGSTAEWFGAWWIGFPTVSSQRSSNRHGSIFKRTRSLLEWCYSIPFPRLKPRINRSFHQPPAYPPLTTSCAPSSAEDPVTDPIMHTRASSDSVIMGITFEVSRNLGWPCSATRRGGRWSSGVPSEKKSTCLIATSFISMAISGT